MNTPQLPPELRPVVHKFEFTGAGGEYFKIWIVNILLTIVTFGIYSAWAKVRRLKYFHQHTQLDGTGFDYHGSPVAILKGRIIAFGALGVLSVAQDYEIMPLYLAGVAIIVLALPWLLRRSFQFRMVNTSYRGLRFGFHGTTREAYAAFGALPALAAVAFVLFALFGPETESLATMMLAGVAFLLLYALIPWAHHRVKAYQFGKAGFGASRFRFKAEARDFYRIYFKTGLVALVPLVVAAVIVALVFIGPTRPDRYGGMMLIVASVGIFIYLALLLAMAGITAMFRAWIHNASWNKTRLGIHRFRATAAAFPYARIAVTNLILTALTLGLYRPFAQIRAARYMVENMKFACFGGIDQFLAGQSEKVAAAGEELAEALDLDIGL